MAPEAVSPAELLKQVQAFLGLDASDNTELKLESHVDTNEKAELHPEGCSCCPVIITIGVSVLDTSSLRSIAPGVKGRKWADMIDAHYVTISERQVTREAALQAQDFEGLTQKMELSETGEWLQKTLGLFHRKLIVIGHDTDDHLKEVKEALGIDVGELECDVLDLGDLYLGAKAVVTGYSSLDTIYDILATLGVGEAHRRNAGSRALHIMQAMLAIACDVKAAVDPAFPFDGPAVRPSDGVHQHGSTKLAGLPEVEDCPSPASTVHTRTTGTPVNQHDIVRATTVTPSVPSSTLSESATSLTASSSSASNPFEDQDFDPSQLNSKVPSVARQKTYTDTEQVAPQFNQAEGGNLRRKVAASGPKTVALGNWLVAEAARYRDISDLIKEEDPQTTFVTAKLSITSPTYRPSTVRAYVRLARIIQAYFARDTDVDEEFLVQLRANVNDRREVSAWYRGLPFLKGSAIDKDNSQHGYFNDCLAEVLGVLEDVSMYGGSFAAFNASRA
ncbi:hypothetical protein LTR36_000081 [Oleoguttula mirabilis]|uniref:Uncharacterized protein n=1 Tax=Oleoguttula mirabilis TaxID=1507867 RepID=A0AAV9JZA9_9PEZI|nr:hypothetical protein LTR36_000081 [Oleoguttula mirabilis]